MGTIGDGGNTHPFTLDIRLGVNENISCYFKAFDDPSMGYRGSAGEAQSLVLRDGVTDQIAFLALSRWLDSVIAGSSRRETLVVTEMKGTKILRSVEFLDGFPISKTHATEGRGHYLGIKELAFGFSHFVKPRLGG
ncbi:hypothetical protein LCGC14_2326420 [marine sediment metagenome]|uniref:Uncharacterized protein n=1 Tax=marine sediment metagenome TaxID=412755 RepID=A0A0F9FB85_9ZZZZ